MVLNRCLRAVMVLSVAFQAASLSAQQLVQPQAQTTQSPWIAERLPSVSGESPQYDPLGRLTASSPEPPDELTQSRATTNGAQFQPLPPVLDEAQLDDSPVVDLAAPAETPRVVGLSDFWGYRYGTSSLDWIIGSGDQFGMFSLNDDHYQQAGVESGLGIGLGFHFVGGPIQTEMPPRLYDFSLAYQCRQQFGAFAYDVAASVMASSDFEGSARRGIRYPAHAVGFLEIHPSAQLVFGVDYLDRGDIKLLPVGGLIWTARDDVRLEFVFPRPRATFALPMSIRPKRDSEGDVGRIAPHNAKQRRLYIAGDLGGGSWAVERAVVHNDLATYRDLQCCIGLECVDQDGSRSAIEVGYLFDRRLEFTSGHDNMRLDDTAMIRWIYCP
ncbi:MAG: hypothetical protein NTW96_25835 [Planctomycetia bacterium]|nr:hypothetical protein [Planctomycetia bacterium]